MTLRTHTQWFGVVLDAPDGPALAHFYARLLGWRVFDEQEHWAAVAPSPDAGYNLAFQTEPLYVRPVWPARAGQPQMSMHLDLEVDDLDEAVAYAVSVGAELADFQPQEEVRVLFDPAGHPFCLYVNSDDPSAAADPPRSDPTSSAPPSPGPPSPGPPSPGPASPGPANPGPA